MFLIKMIRADFFPALRLYPERHYPKYNNPDTVFIPNSLILTGNGPNSPCPRSGIRDTPFGSGIQVDYMVGISNYGQSTLSGN